MFIDEGIHNSVVVLRCVGCMLFGGGKMGGDRLPLYPR